MVRDHRAQELPVPDGSLCPGECERDDQQRREAEVQETVQPSVRKHASHDDQHDDAHRGDHHERHVDAIEVHVEMADVGDHDVREEEHYDRVDRKSGRKFAVAGFHVALFR